MFSWHLLGDDRPRWPRWFCYTRTAASPACEADPLLDLDGLSSGLAGSQPVCLANPAQGGRTGTSHVASGSRCVGNAVHYSKVPHRVQDGNVIAGTADFLRSGLSNRPRAWLSDSAGEDRAGSWGSPRGELLGGTDRPPRALENSGVKWVDIYYYFGGYLTRAPECYRASGLDVPELTDVVFALGGTTIGVWDFIDVYFREWKGQPCSCTCRPRMASSYSSGWLGPFSGRFWRFGERRKNIGIFLRRGMPWRKNMEIFLRRRQGLRGSFPVSSSSSFSRLAFGSISSNFVAAPPVGDVDRGSRRARYEFAHFERNQLRDVRESCSWRPSAVRTDGEAANPGPRQRRRGPRSEESRARRRQRRHAAAHHPAHEQPGTLQEERFAILHVNIRGWASHCAELTARIRLMPKRPDLVCINETFLDKARKSITLEGYNLVARRDRDERSGGGIAVFVVTNSSNHVTLLAHSDAAERSWLLVHTNRGPHLVSAWYRPPEPGEIDTIASFQSEWATHRTMAIGGSIVGDLNVHNKSWLHHSSRDSKEGKALEAACHELGLRQIVSEPTRETNLLDLVMTDIPNAKATVLPRISDHSLVETVMQFKVPEEHVTEREVWQFAKADWDKLRDSVGEEDWSWIQAMDASDAAERLTRDILSKAQDCIPKRRIREKNRRILG